MSIKLLERKEKRVYHAGQAMDGKMAAWRKDGRGDSAISHTKICTYFLIPVT